VKGSTVEMVFEDEITVVCDTVEIAKGGSASVVMTEKMDAIRQFTYSALATENLKGDVRKVFGCFVVLIPDLNYGSESPPPIETAEDGISSHQVETSHHPRMHQFLTQHRRNFVITFCTDKVPLYI
jgi:hypothetical protein